MEFPPVFLSTLVRLLRRDGLAFFGKCAHHAFTPDSWRWLFQRKTGMAAAVLQARTSRWEDVPPEPTPEERERSRRILRDYTPKVSVVVASYNYAHVLRETLDALLAQTYRNFEVLAVDDGSTDGSVAIIREYAAKDPRFSLLHHEGGVNKGLPATVKLAAEAATGEFVAFCESDDIWTPDHLEKKIELLRDHWGAPNFIINDFETFGNEERCKAVAAWTEMRAPKLANVRNRISPAVFREHNWVCTFSICMVRRSVLLGCDMLSVPRPSNLDWWLWRQICFDNDIWCVHEPLTKWRLHKDSYLMRDTKADPIVDLYELKSRMDTFLVRKHPALANQLLPFLRPEDRVACENGKLSVEGVETAQPRLSVVMAETVRPDLDDATLESLALQTYGNFEIVLVSAPKSERASLGDRRDWNAEGPLSGKIRRIAAPAGTAAGGALEAGIAAAGADWAVPVLSGDILRPDALKTFASRIVLQPDANGFHAIARTMADRRNVGGTSETAPGAPPGPFACVGTFAFRRTGGTSGLPLGLRRLSNAEARLAARMLSAPPAVFVPHVVLLYDNRPDGRDPGAERLSASMTECLKACAAARNRHGPASAEIKAIRRSPFFDAAWYLRERPDVARQGIDPAVHYATFGSRSHDCNPSPDFAGDEYLALHYDVAFAGANPLAHYELHGRSEHRPVSFLQLPSSSFPEGAEEAEVSFMADAAPVRRHGRIVLFAAYSASGRIPETTLIYLRGLREVCDAIVFVMDAPILPGEAGKLEGLVDHAVFRHHGGYDFMSWKIAFSKAKELGLPGKSGLDELVFANDSCYGPVFPFAKVFAAMENRKCDFWGLTANNAFTGIDHIQSFFLVFRRRILEGGALERFLGGIGGGGNRWNVILECEAGLTAALSAAGYVWDSLVPLGFSARHGWAPTKHPLVLMRKFGVPLVKAKALAGDMREDRAEVMDFIRKSNPALADAIPPPPPPPDENLPRQLRESHQASFAGKIARIAAKAARGEAVRVLFPVSKASMFPARPLFDAMLADPAFDARILVVPDLRGLVRDPVPDMAKCRAELPYPAEAFVDALPDELGGWQDAIGSFGADIVCYPSPYDLSCFRFNPHWAVGRDFLPIHVNYGFYRSLYDRDIMARQNYAYFWKAFFECEATAKEYAAHSILKGANADVVGYVKMDALASAEPWPRNGGRKRVLIAPHHSVEGGANDSLSLSNFQRYADYFLSLPEKHPELDFVFRPHPFLFTVLSHPSKWGQAKVDDWITRMKAHPNVRWSGEGDYFPAFASCDAIVQDCGSYLVEWFYTGKPCCYMLKFPSDIDAKFSPLGKECLSHCHLAYDEAAIEAFLRDVVEGGNDPKAAARDAFRKTVMVNYPHAADAALASIKRALGLEPPR
jgi:glycosyltransferase involved in cell wall biosynthesis